MFIREIISEGEVIQGNFPNNSSPTENFNIHVFMSPAPGVQPDWIPSKPGSIKDQYDLNKKIEDTLAKGIKENEEHKADQDSTFRKHTSEELGKLIAKGTNVVGGGGKK